MAPLLRLKDNNCHVEESEKVLKKKEKFSELIILYEKKGLHEKGNNAPFLEMTCFFFCLQEKPIYMYNLFINKD